MYFTFLAKIKRLQNVNHAPRPRDGSDGGREAVCPHFRRVCSPNHKNRTNARRTAATAGGRPGSSGGRPGSSGGRPGSSGGRAAGLSSLEGYIYRVAVSIAFKAVSRRLDVLHIQKPTQAHIKPFNGLRQSGSIQTRLNHQNRPKAHYRPLQCPSPRSAHIQQHRPKPLL